MPCILKIVRYVSNSQQDHDWNDCFLKKKLFRCWIDICIIDIWIFQMNCTYSENGWKCGWDRMNRLVPFFTLIWGVEEEETTRLFLQQLLRKWETAFKLIVCYHIKLKSCKQRRGNSVAVVFHIEMIIFQYFWPRNAAISKDS